MTEIKISLSLTADTPEMLSALTVQAQLNYGMQLSFYDFTQLKSGKFICWFDVPVNIYQEKVLNGKA